MPKCQGKDRHMNDCRYNAQDENTKFCKNHQYMNAYDANQLASLSICTGCKKAFYLQNQKICNGCRDRSKQKNKKMREVHLQNLCEHEKCQYKKYGDTSYCKLHEIDIWLDQVKESGKVPCTQYIRGCRNVLDPDGQFKRCEPCRMAERTKDKAKRNEAKAQNAANASSDNESNTKMCTSCGKSHNKEAFVGERSSETLTCIHCRNNGKTQDRKRDQEHRRAQGRIYDSTEARKKRRKEWQKNNWDKVVRAWKKYRERQRAKDENAYLKKNAENASKWRKNNPDAVAAINARKIENIKSQYGVYIQSSNHRNIHFELTIDEYEFIAQNPCYYCGTVNIQRGFNGVDRLDNNLGYSNNNCVACCSMCNYMKGSLHHDVFLRRVEHSMSYLGLFPGNLYPESYPNTKKVTYSSYKQSAVQRSLEFQLTYEEFLNIIKHDCYICGKKNDEKHKNGIDRVNNKEGYTQNNSKSCCRECNFMKSIFSHEKFIEKYKKIRQRHLNTVTKDRECGKYKCESRRK